MTADGKTIVLQSHKSPLPYPWLKDCMSSVQSWAELKQYDYIFIRDEIFSTLPDWIIDKTKQQIVIATDLARLKVLQAYLEQGYQTVIWFDADFLIFDAQNFNIPDSSYALGREVWVQPGKHNQPEVYKKVHNAFLMFRQGNSFLDFYADTASHLLELNTGPMPPQFIGPKLLTALHNIIQCPVLEQAGMLSPLVIQDLLNGSGPALDKFRNSSTQAISGANLCSSLTTTDINQHMTGLIQKLLKTEPDFFIMKAD